MRGLRGCEEVFQSRGWTGKRHAVKREAVPVELFTVTQRLLLVEFWGYSANTSKGDKCPHL